MNLLLREQMTFVAIRRLMKAILGDRKRGLPPTSGDTRVDPVRVLSGPGGLAACFPNPLLWQQLYKRGMGVCPYVDTFWKASSDVSLNNAFCTFVGYDEERDCDLFEEQVFQQLGERIHFHWAYSDLPTADKYQHLRDWALTQPSEFLPFPIVGALPMLGSLLIAASKDFMSMRQNHGLGV
ncbi:hypothetical protein B382_22420 [Stutzerimonas stutzeri B1SMN1]|nr:hypothetical protein B382_22420 [Stutzerimonas stutzeri B1SMN1]